MSRTWKLALLLLAGACQREDLTQTIVWLDAESTARDELSQITVEAVGPDHRLPPVETQNPEWPLKIVLAPKDGDASRRFTLQIEARDAAGDRRMTLRFKSGFVPDRARFARLLIRGACVMQPACETDDSGCNAWSLALSPGELGHSEAQARRLSADCSADQAPPTETDTAADGGMAVAPVVPDDAGMAGASGAHGGSAGAAAAGATDSSQTGTGSGVECDPGFVRDGDECVDVDECATGSPCGDHGRCKNELGAYQCECDSGYQSQSSSCVDVDECATDNGGCEATCVDSIGSVSCACAAGDWLKADRKACGRFGAPKRLGYVGSTVPTQPHFGFDANGNGLAVWTQSDGTNASLWTRRYIAATGWAPFPTKLAISEAGNPSAPSVALDSSGHGAIVWVHTANSHSDIWAVRDEGQSFGTPAKIEMDDAGNALEPTIAVNAQGDGFAAWSQSDGTHSRIWVNRLRSVQGWASAQQIPSTDTEDAFRPRLAIGTDGNASLVWTQSYYVDMSTARFTPWSARFDQGLGRWRAPISLDDTGAAGFPDTQMYEPDGSGLAVWGRYADGRVSILARDFSLTAGWGESIDIAMGESEITAMLPRVAVSPSGAGAAIWAQTEASMTQVWANRYDGASGKWLGAAALTSVDTDAPLLPQLAIDPAGDGFALWSESAGTSRTISAWRLQADVGFSEGVKLTSDTTADPAINSTPQIAIDAQGNAIAIWDGLNAGQYDTWAARFE